MKKEDPTEKYWPYILEIRKRLISILLVFGLFFILGFAFSRQLITLFLKIFSIANVQIIITSPFQVFSLAVNTGLFLATLGVFPFLLLNFLNFLKPALREDEKKLLSPFIFSSLSLFIFGFFFGLFLMRYIIMSFSQAFLSSNISNFWDIGLFLSQIFLTAGLLGIIFQLPLVLWVLLKLGIVKTEELKNKRPYIIAGIFIFIAMLPPTDPFSLILIAMPLIILFEITIFLFQRKAKGGEKLCLA